MAIYVNGITVAQSGTAVGGIEQVAVLPAVGATDHLYFLNVPDATHAVGLYYFDGTVWHSTGSGGGSGTNDYNDLDNKPRIGGIELEDNKSLAQLNIAPANTTYSTTQVDQLISASQKVYLQSTAPTALSNVGLYYVGSPTDTNYAIWLVDSTKQVTNLGNAGISLAGYQRETDGRLTWVATNGVVDAINDLNYRLNNLPSGGTITMNGTVTGSPTFYAPTTSGSFGQKLISYGPNQAPQWVTDSGDAGTKVKLNGSATVAAELSFYAPPFSGTAGQILKSQGPNLAPIWETPGSEAGPAMTLNGSVTDVTATNVKIYAPITSGDNGYILKSKGPGLAPQWEAPGSAGGAYMTLNGEQIAVTVDDAKVYTPKDSGTKAKMLVGNETTNVPTWETSCRSVTLTKDEYDDLSTTKKNDPNIIYYITDDVAGTTEDPSIRWSETLKSQMSAASDKQVYTAKAVNDFISDVKSEIFNAIYPIGTKIIASVKPTMGVWQEVTDATGRALWLTSGKTWGTTISQGLPNIQGSITASTYSFANDTTANITNSGALSTSGSKKASSGESSTAAYPNKISFNASSSNNIYGATTNVQPNAYIIKMWERIS